MSALLLLPRQETLGRFKCGAKCGIETERPEHLLYSFPTSPWRCMGRSHLDKTIREMAQGLAENGRVACSVQQLGDTMYTEGKNHQMTLSLASSWLHASGEYDILLRHLPLLPCCMSLGFLHCCCLLLLHGAMPA